MTPQHLGSHYLLHEQIGQGGMGTVWRAEDTLAGAARAIKVLRPEYARDPVAVARFVRERNALTALRHPNVVALHDMIVEGEQLALVMDLLTEGDLDRYRRDHGGTLPPDHAAELIAQVCDGLTAAHALGIVHRDLKPANVLMDRGRARLTDFGIARIGGEAAVTTASHVLGTVYYMAPEALSGAAPEPHADVYAAGVTLYELLAGRPPFTGQAPVVITGHMQAPPPRPDGVPDPLWRIIATCLAKQPAARPTAAQLAVALRRPETAPAVAPGWPGTPAQRTAHAQRTAPVQRAGTGPVNPAAPVTDAGPHTIVGIGWLTPAGPVGPSAQGMSSTWPVPPPAPGTPAKGGTIAKRWRTWGLVAAAALLVGAGVGGGLALSSGKGRPSAAGTVSPAALTGRATLAATGSPATATTPTPSATRHPKKSASPSPTPTATRSAALPKSTPSASATHKATATPTPTPSSTAPKVSGWVIQSRASLWCLDVAGDSKTSGALIQEGNCVVTDTSQQWEPIASVTLNGLVYYEFKNVASGMCLGVSGASQAVDAAVVQETCTSTADHAQVWHVAYSTASDYELMNAHSGLCAGTSGGSTAENSNIVQGKCINAPVQTWWSLAYPGS